MSFLKKIFGTKSSEKKQPESAPVYANPAEDPNMIRIFDAYGREMFITRQQWRDNVLMGNIQENWNDAEKLAGLITQSLYDNFFEEVIKPAERLLELRPDEERSVVLLAVIYLKVKRLDDSERVLMQFIEKHGGTGSVLTNLAKVYAERGEEDKSLDTLWRSLQLDPNQDNGLVWYEVIQREKGGEAAGIEALQRIAALAGSWRAQLWLARSALKSPNFEAAIALYQESLAHAGKPVPTDLLMQMSGDLGNAGYLAEILQLVEPEFDPVAHGLPVGNNLIKANFDLGRLEEARKILDQLYALQRPDWKQNLGYWDTELAKARIARTEVGTEGQLGVEMLLNEGPIWLKEQTPSAALFTNSEPKKLAVSFLGCSAEQAEISAQVKTQLADAQGRMSRALPLFLAEQVEFRLNAMTQTLVPWINTHDGGFVLAGFAWSNEDAVNYVQQCEKKSDYVVVVHLVTKSEPWVVELRLLRVSDGHCVGQLSESFAVAEPTKAIQKLSQQLVALLSRSEGVKQYPVPSNYSIPDESAFPYYLLRLEQLLAVRCANLDGVRRGWLNGEREIIEGNIQLCLGAPTSINVRLLLASTLIAMKKARPDILPEFHKPIGLLQKDNPLPEPAHGLLQELFAEIGVS